MVQKTMKTKSLQIEPDVYAFLFEQRKGTDRNISNTLRRLLHLKPNSKKIKGKSRKKQGKKFSGCRKKSVSLSKKSAPLLSLEENEEHEESED